MFKIFLYNPKGGNCGADCSIFQNILTINNFLWFRVVSNRNQREAAMKSLSFLFVVILFIHFTSLAQQGWFLQNPYPTASDLYSVDYINELIAIAVGSDGAIVRTIDGGESWTLQNSGTTERLNEVCFVDLINGFAVGNEGTILKTTDGGINWIVLTDTISNDLKGVSFTDALIGTIVGSEGIILRTSNGGENWEPQTSGTTNNLNSVCFTDDSIGTTVGSAGIILRTIDGGTTWTQQTSPTTYDLLDVCFTDSFTGYVGGHGLYPGEEFLKTTDGGQNWQILGISVYEENGVVICLSFINSDCGYALVDLWTANVVCKTTDGGYTWTDIFGVQWWDLLSTVNFIDSSNGMVTGSYGQIHRTADGGATWNSNLITRYDLGGVSFIDSLNGIVIEGGPSLGGGNDILKTTDGGTLWTKLLLDSINYPILTGVSNIDSLTCTIVNLVGEIYRTTDGCNTWTKQTDQSVNWFGWDIDFIDVNLGWAAGGGGKILRTIDGGTNWTEQYSGTTTNLNSISFTDTLTGTVVGEVGTILRTTDGGENWEAQTSGTGELLWDVCFIDSDIGTIVGCGGTILRTTDGGSNWILQSSGTTGELTGVSFTDSLIGTLVGGGWLYSGSPIILGTTDGGETWIEQTIPAVRQLFAVCFVNSDIGWTVGASGTILKTTNGGVSIVEETEIDEIPSIYYLSSNYPNPFNPATKIRYSILQSSNVVIKVFDILGNEIETLVNEEKPVGTYELMWNAVNLPSGVYFYRLQAGNFIQTKKMVLMK